MHVLSMQSITQVILVTFNTNNEIKSSTQNWLQYGKKVAKTLSLQVTMRISNIPFYQNNLKSCYNATIHAFDSTHLNILP